MVYFKEITKFLISAKAHPIALEKLFYRHDFERGPTVSNIFIFILDMLFGMQKIDHTCILVTELVGFDRVFLRGIIETTIEQNSLSDRECVDCLLYTSHEFRADD